VEQALWKGPAGFSMGKIEEHRQTFIVAWDEHFDQ
jgi:hypothetical protein